MSAGTARHPSFFIGSRRDDSRRVEHVVRAAPAPDDVRRRTDDRLSILEGRPPAPGPGISNTLTAARTPLTQVFRKPWLDSRSSTNFLTASEMPLFIFGKRMQSRSKAASFQVGTTRICRASRRAFLFLGVVRFDARSSRPVAPSLPRFGPEPGPSWRSSRK